MGAYASEFMPEESKIIPATFKPSSSNWIIAHTDACDVPLLKVQRCWHRFLQLGANRNGQLTAKSKVWTTEKNRFVQQVLRQLPWNDKGFLTFQVYVLACAWFEAASVETKLKVLFSLLNKGGTVDAGLLQRVVGHIYQSQSQANLTDLAESTVKQIDRKGQGYFDEEDFVKWMMKTPEEELNKILAFEIVPSDTLQRPPR